MKKNIKKENEDFNEYVDMLIEIDTEKKVICISNRSNGGKGIAKRYRNKKDIMRIFGNYLYQEVDIYPSIDERK